MRHGKKQALILAAAAAASVGLSHFARGANATWSASPTSSFWNAGNWVGGSGAAGAAAPGDALFFGTSSITSLNNDFGAGTTFTGINFLSPASGYVIGGNAFSLGGDITDGDTANTETLNTALVLTASRNINVAAGGKLVLGGAISNSFGLTLTGTGTVVLGASNTYTGTTSVTGGTLELATGASIGASAGTLILGTGTPSTGGGSVANLNLSNASATIGTLLVNANSTSANTIVIGSNRTLTIGTMAVGQSGSFNVANQTTSVNFTGGGTLAVNGNITVAQTTGSNNASANFASADLSGLGTFIQNNSTGLLVVGSGTIAQGRMVLASLSNNITVATLSVGTSSGGNNGPSSLTLGTGNNVINAGNINVGMGKSNASINFASSSIGSLTIRGVGGGSTRSSITLGLHTSGTGSHAGTLNLDNHPIDIMASTLVIGGGSTGTGNAGLQFNNGTLDVQTVNMGQGTNAVATSGSLTVDASGLLKVSTAFAMANSTGSGAATDTFNIRGGTAQLSCDITRGAAAVNAATINLTGGTLDMGGHAIGTSAAPISFNAPVVGQTARLMNLGGAGMNAAGLNMNGTGTLIIDGPSSTYTGGTTISSGRLIAVGNLPSGGVATLSGGTLGGHNSNVGNLTMAGGVLAPGLTGGDGSVGTLNINNLTVGNNSVFRLDLSPNAGSTDFVNVTGTANFNGPSNILPIFTGGVVPGTYTLLTAAGGLSGTAPTAGVPGSTTRVNYTVHFGDTVTNTITLDVAGGSAAVTWVGGVDAGGGTFVWDVNSTSNWTSTATTGDPNKYYDLDTVTFDDSSTNKTVTLNSQVTPASVTINANSDYTFTGTGTITGDTGLVKSGNGTATILLNNNYGGTTTVNAGTLIIGGSQSTTGTTVINGGSLLIGAGGTTGSLGPATITVNTGGTLVANHSDDLSIGNVITGSGSVVKNGAGKLTLTATNTYSGTTTVNAGTVLVTNATTAAGSSLGQTSNGGAATFSPGSVLDLASTPAANGLNFGNKPFFVAGNGSGTGVIVNNGNSQQNVFRVITLTGDATFTANQVTDMRNNPTTSLGGTLTLNGNTLHKAGSSRMSLVGIDVTTGTIMVESGTLSIETASRLLADPGSAVIYQPNTIGAFFETTGTTTVNRQMVVNGSGVTFGPASSNLAAISSPIQLKGDLVVQNLTANQTGTLALLGNITEDGTSRKITKNGNGTGSSTLVLGGTNSFSGGLDINSGVVQLNSASALPSTGTVNLGSDTALLRVNGNSITLAGLNSGSSQAVIENASATPSTLTVNNTNDSNFGGILRDGTGGGALSLLKAGTARLSLSGSNSYTGTTTISGGTIELNGSGTLAPSSNIIGSGAGGTLALNRGDNIAFTNSLSGPLNVYKQGGGQLTLPSTYSYTGSATLESGTTLVSGALTPTGTINITGSTLTGTGNVGATRMDGGSIHPGANANDGVIGTTTVSGLTVNGGEMRFDLGPTSDLINVTGAAVFNGGNISVAGVPLPGTYTILTAGALTLNTPPSVNQPSDPNNRPATYALNTSTPKTLKLTITGGPISVTWTGANSGTWDIHTTQNWTSGSPDFFYNLDTANFTESSAVRNVSLDTSVSPTNAIFSHTTGNYTISGGGQISGSGGVTISGGGTVFMNINNSYTGTTAVQNGTLVLGGGNGNAIGNGSPLVLGDSTTSGVVDLNGNDVNLGGLATSGTGAANIIGNSSTSNDSRINVNAGIGTFAGVIQDVLGGGSHKLNVTLNNATITFTGNNTYSGQTQINGSAALQIGAGGNTGSFGASTVNNDGTLIFNRSDTLTISQDIGGGGKTVVNSGTIVVGNGATAGRLSSGAITDNATIVLDRTDNLNVDNTIGGTGLVQKNNTNTVTITASNSFSGGLMVNNGAVRLNNAAAAGTGTITVNNATAIASLTTATIANPIVLNAGLLGGITTLTFSGDLTNTGISTIRMADPQNLPGGAQDVSEIMFTGNLHGSGTINVLSNGQDNNPDGGAGFRFRGTGVSDFAGTVVFGNNVKGELQTGSVGLYSPAGTGKLIVTAGDATLAGTLTTQTTTGGYSELNLRNNSTGNATFGNDIEVAGTGLAVLNPLGNAPIGAIIGMGNLKIGAGQELGIYDASGNVHAAAFNSVTLTGGNATFSPRTANFGTAGTVGGDLLLGSITELAPNSSITMTGLRTLTLTGSNSYTGGTTVVAGTLVTNTNFSNGTLTINGGKAKVAAKATNNDPSGTTTVPSLTIALGATLDLTNNSAVINYTTSPLTDIRGQLLSGYANGAWTGTGLSSSSAQAAASGAIKTAIGYTDTGTALMLKYTVSGDANLDGVTNALDFNALASNFGQPSADRWNKGDFNYDGVVNTGDFTALAQNFNAILPATPPPAPALGSLVPEPTSLAMLGLLTVITRRRHQLSRA